MLSITTSATQPRSGTKADVLWSEHWIRCFWWKCFASISTQIWFIYSSRRDFLVLNFCFHSHAPSHFIPSQASLNSKSFVSCSLPAMSSSISWRIYLILKSQFSPFSILRTFQLSSFNWCVNLSASCVPTPDTCHLPQLSWHEASCAQITSKDVPYRKWGRWNGWTFTDWNQGSDDHFRVRPVPHDHDSHHQPEPPPHHSILCPRNLHWHHDNIHGIGADPHA